MSLVALGEPRRITGDMLITLSGDGEARFRLQHTRDDGGAPDPFGWSDVTQVSNGALDPHDAIRPDSVYKQYMGDAAALIDRVDGECRMQYRHHRADWLRVIPADEEDARAVERCARYRIVFDSVT